MFNRQEGTAMLSAQLVQVQSEGDVTLGSLHQMVITHNYLKDESDVKSFIAICKMCVKIHEEMGKQEALGEILIPKNMAKKYGTDLTSDALWEAWLRHYANTLYHPSSTCRIGDVVDS